MFLITIIGGTFRPLIVAGLRAVAPYAVVLVIVGVDFTNTAGVIYLD